MKRRVLIVGDNRAGADTLGLFLELEGWEVNCAYDGEQGLDAFGSFQPGLVLMDLGLPCMSGLETARQMQKLPDSAGVIFIAMTGWDQERDREATREAGFAKHLVKPVEPAHLRELLLELNH